MNKNNQRRRPQKEKEKEKVQMLLQEKNNERELIYCLNYLFTIYVILFLLE